MARQAGILCGFGLGIDVGSQQAVAVRVSKGEGGCHGGCSRRDKVQLMTAASLQIVLTTSCCFNSHTSCLHSHINSVVFTVNRQFR